MRQNSHTRNTRRDARRHNHLGLLACLLAVLCGGVLIGRLTIGRTGSDEVYLSTSEPPAAVHATSPLGSTAKPRVNRAMAAQVVTLANAARVRSGCAPLRVDGRLTRAAKVHSREMAASGIFAHSSPDGSTPWQRMERAGYRLGAAENIGHGYTSAKDAVRGWLASADHRRNILDCGYRAIGVGVARGADGTYWTQDFGYS